jgi:hypothetical protein
MRERRRGLNVNTLDASHCSDQETKPITVSYISSSTNIEGGKRIVEFESFRDGWWCGYRWGLKYQHKDFIMGFKTKEVKKMNINDFAKKVAETEGLKKQVNIAQIKEILKIVNKLLKGALYKTIRVCL